MGRRRIPADRGLVHDDSGGASGRFRVCRDRPTAPASPEEAPANWVKRRREPDDDSPRWVRRVKGGAYQARYWLEVVGGSLNPGLFTLAEHDDWRLAQWTAARASKAFQRLWVGSRTVREAVEILQLKRPLPPDAPREWKLRTPWVPPSVVVPEKWANLALPTDYGELKNAQEKREERRQRLLTLEDFLSPRSQSIAATHPAPEGATRERPVAA